MESVVRAALALLLCSTLATVLIIAATIEDKVTKLLRELRISKRLSSGECDLLRPPIRNHLKDSSSREFNIRDFEKEACLHRRLLLEGRIAASEFEILFAAYTKGLTPSWRCIAKDRIITWLRSWRNPFRKHPSPVARVLQTAELLERILIYIPHQDLALHIPRTCKRFRDATRISPCLRRRLFLEPDYKFSQRLPLPLRMIGTGLRLRSAEVNHPFGRWQPRYENDFDRVLVKRLKAYPTLQGVLIAQPPIHSVSMNVDRFEERSNISNSADTGVTVGDVIMKLDKMFEEMAQAIENQDPGVRRFRVELNVQEQE